MVRLVIEEVKFVFSIYVQCFVYIDCIGNLSLSLSLISLWYLKIEASILACFLLKGSPPSGFSYGLLFSNFIVIINNHGRHVQSLLPTSVSLPGSSTCFSAPYKGRLQLMASHHDNGSHRQKQAGFYG